MGLCNCKAFKTTVLPNAITKNQFVVDKVKQMLDNGNVSVQKLLKEADDNTEAKKIMIDFKLKELGLDNTDFAVMLQFIFNSAKTNIASLTESIVVTLFDKDVMRWNKANIDNDENIKSTINEAYYTPTSSLEVNYDTFNKVKTDIKNLTKDQNLKTFQQKYVLTDKTNNNNNQPYKYEDTVFCKINSLMLTVCDLGCKLTKLNNQHLPEGSSVLENLTSKIVTSNTSNISDKPKKIKINQ